MTTDLATTLAHLKRQLPVEFGRSNPAARIADAALAGLDIGLTPSKKLTAALTEYDHLHHRADEHRTALTATPTLNLADDDYPDRLREHLISRQLGTEAEHVTRQLLTEAAQHITAAVKTELPTLFDQLDTLYQERYPDLLALGDTRASTAVLAARHDFAGQLTRAHNAFMAVDSRHHTGDLDYRVELWLHHQWTADQWQQAIDSTGPLMNINRDVDHWHLAHRCGATPRLARSHTEAIAQFHALDNAIEHEQIEQAHARSASAVGARSVREAVKNFIH